MSSPTEPIEKLASLLEGSEARPIVVPSRLAPSAIYDLDYRAAVVALVFENSQNRSAHQDIAGSLPPS
jgi:hypothetical protein